MGAGGRITRIVAGQAALDTKPAASWWVGVERGPEWEAARAAAERAMVAAELAAARRPVPVRTAAGERWP